jgi:hypothetical protein
MLRTKEYAPIPSVIFTSGLAVESIKELGGASKLGKITNILKVIFIHGLQCKFK